MTKSRNSNASQNGFDPAEFDRQLAELQAALARIEADLSIRVPEAAAPAPRARKPRTPRPRTEPATPAPDAPPVGNDAPSAPSGVAEAAPAAPASPPPAPAPRPEPALPTGTDLNDPKNFGQLPPVAELEQGLASEDEFRLRVSRHLDFAMKVLQTSGVPAAVWREWRAFEKAARQRLQEIAERAAALVAAE